MANNKVQLSNGTVLVDLTDTTATAEDVVSGKAFYGADGVKTTGTYVAPSASMTGLITQNDDALVLSDTGNGTEIWDIELYKDPSTGRVETGGTFPAKAGDTWYITWSAYTDGFVVGNGSGYACYPYSISYSNPASSVAGGSTSIVMAADGNMVIGIRWNLATDTKFNGDWIKVRITRPSGGGKDLTIFGRDYNNVSEIIAKDQNDNDVIFHASFPYITQDEGGFLVINKDGTHGYISEDWGNPAYPVGEITINREYFHPGDADRCAYLFARRTGITKVNMPNTTYLPNNFFMYSSISEFNAPNLEYLGYTSFSSCAQMTGIVLPKCKDFKSSGGLMQMANLLYADIGGATGGTLKSNAFNYDAKLTTIILRSTTLWVCENVNIVANTPFKSGGTGGTIYIPKVLYDHLGDGTSLDYKAATNWSTIDGYGTITWAKIEGSQYENKYADGTDIPTT